MVRFEQTKIQIKQDRKNSRRDSKKVMPNPNSSKSGGKGSPDEKKDNTNDDALLELTGGTTTNNNNTSNANRNMSNGNSSSGPNWAASVQKAKQDSMIGQALQSHMEALHTTIHQGGSNNPNNININSTNTPPLTTTTQSNLTNTMIIEEDLGGSSELISSPVPVVQEGIQLKSSPINR